MATFMCWIEGRSDEDHAREVHAFDVGSAAETHVDQRFWASGCDMAHEQVCFVRDESGALWKCDVIGETTIDWGTTNVVPAALPLDQKTEREGT